MFVSPLECCKVSAAGHGAQEQLDCAHLDLTLSPGLVREHSNIQNMTETFVFRAWIPLSLPNAAWQPNVLGASLWEHLSDSLHLLNHSLSLDEVVPLPLYLKSRSLGRTPFGHRTAGAVTGGKTGQQVKDVHSLLHGFTCPSAESATNP